MLERLKELLGEAKVLVQEPMAFHTTFRIGGPADYSLHGSRIPSIAASM